MISISSALVGLALFGHYYLQHHNILDARSYAFGTFAVNSMIYIFAYRSMRRSIFQMPRLSQNKPLIVAAISGLVIAVGAFLVAPIRNLLGITPIKRAPLSVSMAFIR